MEDKGNKFRKHTKLPCIFICVGNIGGLAGLDV